MPDEVTSLQGRVLRVVDSHTCGQPTRVIVSGTGLAAGTMPLTAQQELRDRHDWIRRVAVLEPRGHRSMFRCSTDRASDNPIANTASFTWMPTACGRLPSRWRAPPLFDAKCLILFGAR